MANRGMKDSGIEWIGEIPESWEVSKIKYLHDGKSYSFIDGDWIDAKYIVNNGIRYFTTGNIGDGKFKVQGDGYISEETFEFLNCKFAYAGDLIFSRLNAPYGRSCILPDMEARCVVAVDNVILRTEHNKKYICYVTQCYGYQRSVEDKASGTTMKRISRTNLGNIYLPLPPLPEQKAIADYLDTKCAEIDGLKADITEQIEVLKQYKQSVITEAVTKGLDPDVPMKDSGIEWIGEIPESWEVSRVKYVTKQIGSGTTPTASNMKYYDGDYNWIQSGDIYNKDIISTTEKTVSYSALLEVSSLRVFKSDFIVIAMYGASVGNVAISKIDACTNQACCVLKTDDFYSLKYLYYVLKSSYKVMIGKAIGGTQPNISQILIKNLNVLLPPLEEQKAIADYLDTKCAEIDQIIESKGQQLEALEEYKKSMIYEYVTGKKEVPQEV